MKIGSVAFSILVDDIDDTIAESIKTALEEFIDETYGEETYEVKLTSSKFSYNL